MRQQDFLPAAIIWATIIWVANSAPVDPAATTAATTAATAAPEEKRLGDGKILMAGMQYMMGDKQGAQAIVQDKVGEVADAMTGADAPAAQQAADWGQHQSWGGSSDWGQPESRPQRTGKGAGGSWVWVPSQQGGKGAGWEGKGAGWGGKGAGYGGFQYGGYRYGGPSDRPSGNFAGQDEGWGRRS